MIRFNVCSILMMMALSVFNLLKCFIFHFKKKEAIFSKTPLNSFCVGQLQLGMGPTLSCGSYTQRDSIGES